ncbi:unnamed protein product [Arabidopsis halleri]
MGKSSKKSTTKDEATPAVIIKPTKPTKKGKREPEDDLETKVNLKKQKKDKKKNSENKETMEGFTNFLQMIEARVDLLTTKVDLLTSKVDLLTSKVDLLATNADLDAILTSAKEVTETKNPDAADKYDSITAKSSEDESEDDSHDEKKAAPPIGKASSSLDSADKDSDEVVAERGSVQTIYIEGFGSSLPEDDIKSALSKHFSGCGEITRVFVPTNHETGAVKGFAYIDLKEGAKKALELNGSDMKGKELVVKKALLLRDSYPGYSGNGGIGGRFGGRFGSVGGIYGGGRCGGYGRCGRC